MMIDTLVKDKALIKGEFDEFQNELLDSFSFFNSELSDIYSDNIDLKEKILLNLSDSNKYLERFLKQVDLDIFFKLTPEVSIDDDGEISIEWFGKIGSRCSLTFGSNGMIYFAAIDQDSSINFKKFINKESIFIFENEIEKISKSVK